MLPIIQFSQEFPHIKAFLGTLLEKKEIMWGKFPKGGGAPSSHPKILPFPLKGNIKVRIVWSPLPSGLPWHPQTVRDPTMFTCVSLFLFVPLAHPSRVHISL